jgi:hypothetical protein
VLACAMMCGEVFVRFLAHFVRPASCVL